MKKNTIIKAIILVAFITLTIGSGMLVAVPGAAETAFGHVHSFGQFAILAVVTADVLFPFLAKQRIRFASAVAALEGELLFSIMVFKMAPVLTSFGFVAIGVLYIAAVTTLVLHEDRAVSEALNAAASRLNSKQLTKVNNEVNENRGAM